VHDERPHALRRIRIDLEIGHIRADPCAAAPPDLPAPRIPGLAGGVAGGAVVLDAAVCRPRPRPVERLPIAEGIGVVAPGHLVASLSPGAAEDPAAARGGAVIPELGEAVKLLSRLPDDLRLVLRIDEVDEGLSGILLSQLLGGRIVCVPVGPRETKDGIREGPSLGLVKLPEAQED